MFALRKCFEIARIKAMEMDSIYLELMYAFNM